jgi:hypothetical protein
MLTRNKRAVLVTSQNPLCAGVLRLTLDFVGPGYGLYISPVCKAWQESYKGVAAVTVAVVTWDGRSISFTCGPAHTLRSAASASSTTLRWARRCGLHLKGATCAHIAGRCAEIDTLAEAHALGLPWSASLLNSVAGAQKLEALQWLHTDAQCPLPPDITHSAASGGSVAMLQWLAAVGCVFDRCTSCAAASAGHMHVLQFLREQGCPFDKDCVDAAAERGDLAMVQWLLQQGCPWRKTEVVHIAAASGSVALMEWLLHEHVFVMADDLMASAAEAGQLAMCQYLREQECPWSELACLLAARAGHCEVLRWLREAGCPRHPDEVCLAAAAGSVATLAYLQQAGELPDAQLTAALAAAGANDELSAAVWLRQEGAEWPAVLEQHGDCPYTYWPPSMVAWARAEGCTSPVSEQFIDPYSTSERADAHSAASDSSDEFSSCSDTDEDSSSDHIIDSDASSTRHNGDTSSDDSGDELGVNMFA